MKIKNIVFFFMAHGERDTIIFGDGTDLLVLFIHYWKEWGPSENNLYMFRPLSETHIHIKMVVNAYPRFILYNILTIHCLSGCDTVSSCAGVGKNKLIKAVMKNP